MSFIKDFNIKKKKQKKSEFKMFKFKCAGSTSIYIGNIANIELNDKKIMGHINNKSLAII